MVVDIWSNRHQVIPSILSPLETRTSSFV
jgi:hypothetical protein